MTTEPFKVDGVDYSAEGVRTLREEIIILRDEALNQTEMTWVVVLSHNIALLSYLADLQDQRAAEGPPF